MNQIIQFVHILYIEICSAFCNSKLEILIGRIPTLTFKELSTTIIIFNLFFFQTSKSLLLRIKCVFKHQELHTLLICCGSQ